MISGEIKFFRPGIVMLLIASSIQAGPVADVLPSIGAMVGQTVSSAVTAAASVDVAKINADAEVKNTTIVANEKKYEADLSAQTASLFAHTTKDIVESNNKYQTMNLEKTLMYKLWQDTMDNELKRDQIYHDYTQKLAEIAEKRETAKAQLELDKMKMAMDRVKNGLAPGYTVQSSELTVSSINSGLNHSASPQAIASTTSTRTLGRNFGGGRGSLPLTGNISHYFGQSLALGSSPQSKRSDLQAFKEQGMGIAAGRVKSNTADMGRPHRYSPETGFENTGHTVMKDGHASVARHTTSRRYVLDGRELSGSDLSTD